MPVFRLVEVDYEDLPAVLSCADAIEANSYFEVPQPPLLWLSPPNMSCLVIADAMEANSDFEVLKSIISPTNGCYLLAHDSAPVLHLAAALYRLVPCLPPCA